MRFFDVVVDQGLMNPNTARGWSAACSRIFEDIPDANDVRSIDVLTAIKRYHNRHPGQLKGTVLKEYQHRLTRALADFTKYTEDPTSYKGRGKGPTEAASKPRARKAPISSALEAPRSSARSSALSALSTLAAAAPSKVGMTLDFNMRSDFMAQVVVPRDMKADEARRLS